MKSLLEQCKEDFNILQKEREQIFLDYNRILSNEDRLQILREVTVCRDSCSF
jgi:hypothetical protein